MSVLHLAVALLLLAATASAERFGPINVEPLEGVSIPRRGCYYEYRFTAFNPTADPHTVRIEVAGEVMHLKSVTRASRTVVVAPRTAALVSIPKFVVEGSVTSEANISVDGDAVGTLPLATTSSSGRGYRTTSEVLVGRSVAQSLVAAVNPTDESFSLVRTTLPPRAWSANWLSYTPLSGAILTIHDWAELPQPVQAAILRWVSAGGSLTLIGAPPRLPPLRPDLQHGLAGGRLGFGWIVLLPADAEALGPQAPLRSTWSAVHVESPYLRGDVAMLPRPLLDEGSMPVKSLFGVLILFAIVGGPVNMFVLAKKKRRVWIFWTIPILAVIASAVLVGALVLNEGWVRIQKTTTVTLLDEVRGEASTIGWTGIYATLSQDGKVRFDSGTEVRPLFMSGDEHTDWTDGQRFVAGWIGSRVTTSFIVRKVEPRRERLQIRRVGDHLVVLNGLGADIKQLWVASELGNTYSATNIGAGKEVVLKAETLTPGSKDPALIYGPPFGWPNAYDRVAGSPSEWLRPGSYVALVDQSPFLERALADPTKSTSQAVVIGIMKGIDHAG